MSSKAADNITNLLAKTSCYCLNEDPRAPWTHLLVGDETLALKSDTDEQIVLHLAFAQTCSLNKLVFGVPNDDTAPGTVKLFLNQNNIGFSDANEMKPIQICQLTPGQEITIDLSPAKWSRTESITIFVQDNHGSSISSLHSIRIYGSAVMNSANGELKQCC